MASVEFAVDTFQRVVPGGDRWMAVGFAMVATIVVVALYGSAPSPVPGPAPALRAVTNAQVAALTSALGKDWARARAADAAWINTCYAGGPGSCVNALRRQVTALQRLLGDVSPERLAGTRLAPILDGPFARSVAAALAVKQRALALLAPSEFPGIQSSPVKAVPPISEVTYFTRHDTDPLICIQPVGAVIQKATGRSASHPRFLPYPLSTGSIVVGRSGSCPAALAPRSAPAPSPGAGRSGLAPRR